MINQNKKIPEVSMVALTDVPAVHLTQGLMSLQYI